MKDISGECLRLQSVVGIYLFYYFSNLTLALLTFHFMDSRYKRSFSKKIVYHAAFILMSLLGFLMNAAGFIFLCFVTWEIQTVLAALFLYHDDRQSPLRRMAECAGIHFYLCLCDTGANVLMWACFQSLKTPLVIQVGTVVIFSKLVLLIMYFLVLLPLMRKLDGTVWKKPHLIHLIVLGYTLLNSTIIIRMSLKAKADILCLINMGCIILADIYIIHFVRISEEKKRYENQVRALEQQAHIQYEYYLMQTKKYEQTVRILHDANKHIQAIENLHLADQPHAAEEYAAQLRKMLKPLIPVGYSDNPILNILLSDKCEQMKDQDISVEISIDHVSLSFLEPIDVTTIFGNLLENAIEAAKQVSGKRFVRIKISSGHKMAVVRIENTCGDVVWKNGKPVSQKGSLHGLGLLNVRNSIAKYDGDLTLRQEEGCFVAEFFLNMP